MLFLAIALAVPPPAVEPPIWRLTPEERVQKRFDPTARQARALAAEQARVAAGKPPAPQEQDVILGRENPELLLPFEIFRRLVRVGFSSNIEARDIFRKSLEPARRDLGLPADFWAQLEGLTGLYRAVSDRQKPKPVLEEPDSPDLDAEAKEVCSSRALALQASRQAFGSDKFDRFLYLGVAPDMFLVTTGDGPSPERLLALEKGCE